MRIGKYEIKKKKLIVLLSAFIVPFNLYSLAWFPPSPYVQRGIFICSDVSVQKQGRTNPNGPIYTHGTDRNHLSHEC